MYTEGYRRGSKIINDARCVRCARWFTEQLAPDWGKFANIKSHFEQTEIKFHVWNW